MQEVLGHLGPISEVKGIQIGSVNQNSVLKPPREKAIRVVLSTFLPSILSRSQQSNKRFLSGLRLVVCENLELLDPSYELGVTSLLHATQTQPTRYIGLSNSLTDPTDLAAWLKVDPFALHSFPPSDREQALSTITQTFTIPQTAALFKAMAKPAHDAIRDKGDKQAIVFVPSRGLCSSIARDLVTQCALESETDKGYLPAEVTPDHLEAYLIRSQDVALVEALSRGVGFFHGGLSKQDRSLVLEMYTEGIVRVLIVPRDALWSLPVRAGVVVVMGTQYFHITPSGERLQLQNYGWEELVQMQGRAVRHGAQGYFHLFCQTEGMDTLIRFLSRGLPLESRLLETGALQDWYQEQKQSGQIRDKQDVLDALSFTYLARRLESNPNYYDASSGSKAEVLSRVVDKFYDVTST